VNVMSGDCWASMKALEGYTAFHHLFLAFCQTYPKLQKKVDEKLEYFIRNKNARTKDSAPSLGDLITFLSVSERFGWGDLASTWLPESMDRNVLWVAKEFPEIARPKDLSRISDDRLLEMFFSASGTSKRLTMFHVRFLSLARPAGRPLADVKTELDMRFGRPTPKMQAELQSACRQILSVSRWRQFFGAIGVKGFATPAALAANLRQSIKNSAEKGYHRGGGGGGGRGGGRSSQTSSRVSL